MHFYVYGFIQFEVMHFKMYYLLVFTLNHIQNRLPASSKRDNQICCVGSCRWMLRRRGYPGRAHRNPRILDLL